MNCVTIELQRDQELKITRKLIQSIDTLNELCSKMPSAFTVESEVLAAEEKRSDVDFNYMQLQKYEDIYDRDCIYNENLDNKCLQAHTLVKKWKNELTERKIHFHMHLKVDTAKIPEVKIPKYSGKPDEMVIFEFLDISRKSQLT